MSVLYRQGGIQIPAVAQHAGMSTRQFERRSHTRDPNASKALCENCPIRSGSRENKAVSIASPWTDVANQLEYYDQMHLIHDFKEFSGELPTSLLSQLKMNLDTHLNGVRSSQIALTSRKVPN